MTPQQTIVHIPVGEVTNAGGIDDIKVSISELSLGINFSFLYHQLAKVLRAKVCTDEYRITMKMCTAFK